MKYSTVAVVTAFVAGAAAQFGFPPCPGACVFQSGAQTDCPIIDVACSCRDRAYQAQIAACMAKCAPADAAKGAEIGAKLCKDAGVELTIPSITSTVPAPTSVVTPTTTASATETPAPTTTSTAEPTTTPPVEEDDDEEDDDEEEDGATTTVPVVVAPTTTLISSTTVSGRPVATGNATTNGTVTPPIATGVPTPGEDSGAARVAFGSLMGIAVMGAVVFAL